MQNMENSQETLSLLYVVKMSLNSHEMAYIYNIINDIYDQI